MKRLIIWVYYVFKYVFLINNIKLNYNIHWINIDSKIISKNNKWSIFKFLFEFEAFIAIEFWFTKISCFSSSFSYNFFFFHQF